MIIATNNKGKLKEFRNILSNYNIYSLEDMNINIDVVEDGKTFLDNAKKKAIQIYNICHKPVIADDSGLCILELDDYPGVYTHRVLGDNSNNELLIEKVNKCKNRDAKVVCTLVYYDGINTIISTGILEGEITRERRGNNGFGFDDVFQLPSGKTLAELTTKEKDLISARYLAITKLKNKLEGVLEDDKKINI